ncbi:MAG: NeuD/PglB/VioB family sugar acetyltransferase [Hymenobacteraceae bacterium]|nr:NeuD/PglB/VioB family sugar acetyltransferase [Hymenobacteraceae bacterium]
MTDAGLRDVALIGYSGHAWVVADCLLAAGERLGGYCERTAVARDPYHLPYLGPEAEAAVLVRLRALRWIVSVGDNTIRARVQQWLSDALGAAATIVQHPSAVLSSLAELGAGTLLAPLAVVNAAARVGQGCIINTGAIVEHECQLGDFVHVAPGAVLAGNVTVGAGALIGVGAAVRPGIRIGAGALVGAGAVVVKDVPAGARVVGNPLRLLLPAISPLTPVI